MSDEVLSAAPPRPHEAAASLPGFWRAWRTNAEAQALAMAVVFVLLRAFTAPFVGLGVDESYTIAISRPLALSYFDHPPLHHWIVHVTGALLGWGPVVRAPFILMSGVTSWLMYRLGRRLFGVEAGLWTAFVFNVSGFFSFAAGAWVLPDGPLNLCLAAAALHLAVICFDDASLTKRREWLQWLAVGAWLGLAGLSKYQAVLFVAGLLLFLATTPHQRRWFRHPAPYAAAVLALAIVSPVIVWNAQHHWVSIAFQGERGIVKHGLKPGGLFSALAGQAIILFPWIFVPLVATALGALRSGRTTPKRWFVLLLAAPAILIFMLTPVWGDHSLPHWSMPGWLMLMPALGDVVARWRRLSSIPRIWAWSAAVACAMLWVFTAVEIDTGLLGKLSGRSDPTVESVQWTGLRPEVLRRLEQRPKCLFITALSWNEAGKIAAQVGDLVPVRVLAPDPRGFAFLRPSPAIGCDALVIARPSRISDNRANLAAHFKSISVFGTDFEGRHTREVELTILDARGLLQPFSEAP